MGKQNFQKVKLLKIWEMLCKDSDENHTLDTVTIIENLNKQGINCDRKTLYSDIAELNNHGYTVFKKRSRRNQYYVEQSEFSVPELRILIDAVQSANFISQQKTDDLVAKIANLSGSYKADTLKNGVYFDTQKYDNEAIYNNILKLDEAINNDKKVSFKYFDYDENGLIAYRKDGARYEVNPVALVFNSQSYYLVCYSDKYKNLANFRVDRIDNVVVEKEKITPADCNKDFDIAEYRRKAFSMYTGKEYMVELEFDESLIEVMMDKFGVAIKIKRVDENKCRLKANLQISPTFFGWCNTFGKKLKIITPKSVVDTYIKTTKESIAHYDNKEI